MPWDVLAARVVAELPGANVVVGPAPALEPDAVVIRPDEPWMEHTEAGYRTRPENYVAIAASRVSDPASSLDSLYRMVAAITEAASDEGWDWVSVSGITLDETTGVPLLVVAVRVKYQHRMEVV